MIRKNVDTCPNSWYYIQGVNEMRTNRQKLSRRV